jgi:hypothetical protein
MPYRFSHRVPTRARFLPELWVAYPLQLLQRVYLPWQVGALIRFFDQCCISATHVLNRLAQLCTSTLIRTAASTGTAP